MPNELSEPGALTSPPVPAPPKLDVAHMTVVPVPHPVLWISSALAAAAFAWIAWSIWSNPNIDHATIVAYQFAPAILAGLRTTLLLAFSSAAIGLVLGIALAVMRLSDSLILRLASQSYVWLVRGTPLLVQIVIWGNFALLFRHIGPYSTNDVLTPFVASMLALGLNEAAYMAEVVRAGLLSVDHGQQEASIALGMTRAVALRRIILPQALRVIIPPWGNQFISLLKATSLVSVIAGGDLLTAAQNISSSNLRTIELMLVATFWYLFVTSIAGVAQHQIERRLDRSNARPRHGR
jgi:polar amino acid transport system permease protein